MDNPGRLSDAFDKVQSVNTDPKLDWSNTKVLIDEALDKKKKRRRILLWWWFGTGSAVLALLYFIMTPIANIDSASDSVISEKIASAPASTINIAEQTSGNQSGTDQESKNAKSTSPVQQSPYPAYSTPITKPDNTLSANNKKIGKSEAPVNEPDDQRNKSLVVSDRRPEGTPSLSEDQNTAQNKSNNTVNHRLAFDLDAISTKTFSISSFPFPTDLQGSIADLEAKDKAQKLRLQLWLGGNSSNLHSQFSNSEPLNGIDLELSLRYSISKSTFLTIGLGYVEERFQTGFEQQTDINLYRPETIDTIYRYTNIDDVTILTDSIPGIRTRRFGQTNTMTSLSIPVQFGYEIPMKGISFRPTAGFVPIVRQGFSGQIVSSELDVIVHEASPSMEFSLAYRAGLSVGIQIGKGSLCTRYVWTRMPSTKFLDLQIASRSVHSLQVGYEYPF